MAFLDQRMENKLSITLKLVVDEKGKLFDSSIELKAEYASIKDLFLQRVAYDYMKIGGIYLDGKLRAFSIGCESESRSMAIINVEKADRIKGLYQLINREFLIHEFPDSVLVNREDDVGLEGTWRAKISYRHLEFEYKYYLVQKVFV